MDRITLEVLGSALVAIAEEMGVALIRSSYSSNIKERWDCSTAIFDREGEVIAQAEHIPLHLGSLLGVVREVLRRYPSEALKPGDVFAANDPYTGGGTHLPDITVVAPVFVEGRLFGFVANIAHHADRTGAVIRSIFDEGLRITPIRIVEAHQVREDVMELLLANFALPTQRQGDFRAQIAANRLGERRVLELCGRYGAETVRRAAAEYLQYAERKIRAAIRGIPDGVYRYTDYMDGDGIQPGPIPIAVAMTVAGDRVRLDFSGTGPQVSGDINVVWLALLATAYYALKAVLDPTIPANGGFYRAIEVEAPEGSIVNARPPAAVGWRSQTCQRIADVIFGALAAAVPERVPAAGNGANTAWTFAGTDPKTGRYYVYLETICGGGGALPEADGLDAIQVHTTNTSNLPVECLESEYPLLVEETSLVEGSGGDGRFRGGRGIRRTIEVLDHEAQFFATLERAEVAPWGLKGGGAGGRAALVLNPGTIGEMRLSSKLWGHVLKAGDRVQQTTPGGGGYGGTDAGPHRTRGT